MTKQEVKKVVEATLYAIGSEPSAWNVDAIVNEVTERLSEPKTFEVT